MASNCPPVHATLQQAIAHLQKHQIAEAIAAFRQVLAWQPDHAVAAGHLGSLYLQAGNPVDALPLLHTAVAQLSPQVPLLLAWSQALSATGHHPAALAAAEQASTLDPHSADARYHLGMCLYHLGRWREAAAALRDAVDRRPDHVEALVNLGVIYRSFGRLDEAAACYENALHRDPENADIWVNLGNTRAAADEMAGARQCYDRALGIRPDPGLAIRRALTMPAIVASDNAIDEWRFQLNAELDRLIQMDLRLTDPLRDVGMANFRLAYHGRDDRLLMEKIARLYVHSCPSLRWTAPHCARWEAPTNRRIRVAVVSRYLNRHTIGQLNKGWIARLDRRTFHVTVCQIGPLDDVAQAIAASADAAVHLRGSLADMREAIAAQVPDVVFYTDIGMEPNSYFLAFARLAPVQCVTWGHPDTTGLTSLDYFVSLAAGETTESDQVYTERLVRLPVMGTYFERPEVPTALPGRRQWDWPDEWRLYACPQSLFKLHPRFDAVLLDILRQDPVGRLVLIAGTIPQQAEALRQRLVELDDRTAERVLFLPYQDRTGFYNLLTSADAVLDPAYYCGGRTTYEATAAGVPMVHRQGRFLRDRLTEGIYQQLGVTDTIAADDAEYVQMALRLANDRQWRQNIGTHLVAAGNQIFADDHAVQALEAFLTGAVAAVH